MEAVDQPPPAGVVSPETLKEAQQQDGSPTGDSDSQPGKLDSKDTDQSLSKEDKIEDPPAESSASALPVENGKDDKIGQSERNQKEALNVATKHDHQNRDDSKEGETAANEADAGTQGLLAQAPLVRPETSSATASPRHDHPTQEYHLKWVDWNDRKTPIVTQNENGPCPLIAILNVLLLRVVIEIPEGVEIVTATQLFNYLGNTILQRTPEDATEAVRKNFEKNMSDAMEIVSKLQTGLDVNVRFTGVSDFEYTQECLIFDLLNISLYHGWLYDPQNTELISAIGTCSYNQLVENIIESKNSTEEITLHQGLVAESFLHSSAAQLTYHGLCELNSTIKNNQLCVLFRNNHFSTICKHDDILYILVTDQGFLTASNVVWESLSNVEGDSLFYDGAFKRCQPDIKPETAPPMSMEQQIDSDLLLALSMQEDQGEHSKTDTEGQPVATDDTSNLTDKELAMKLQEEEDLRAAQMVQEQEQAAAAAGGEEQDGPQQGQQPGGAQGNGAMAAPQGAAAARRPREPKEKSCVII